MVLDRNPRVRIAYGAPQTPKEDFDVWLCDEDFGEIASSKFPYAKFHRHGRGGLRSA